MYGQVTDTIFVYDDIIVYDTIKVYDTINVEDKNVTNSEGAENYFKKYNTIENAVLAIDTATLKAELLLFNKNDTATISINSIILSEPNKNLETMKKQILTLATAALVAQAAYAKQNTADSLFSKKKYAVGVGITYTGSGIGGTVKFDYLKTKKLSFGLRSHVTGNKWNDYSNSGSNQPGFESPGFTLHYAGGRVINSFLTTTYHFKKEGYTSNFGLYLVGGLGYQDWKMSETVAYTDPRYDYNADFSYKTFSGLICFGGDYKVGPGKIFLDIPLVINIYEDSEDKIVYTSGNTINYSSNRWITKGTSLTSFAAINFGYTVYF
jgi:hypothetical protein